MRLTQHKYDEYGSQSDLSKLELVFEAAKEGYFCMTPQGDVRFFNKRFYKDFDVDIEHSASTFADWVKLVFEEDRQMLHDAVVLQQHQKQDIVISHYRILNRKGECVWIEALGKLVLDADGEIEAIVGYHADITERKVHEDSVADLAYKDSLTGLFNRNWIYEELSRHLKTKSSAQLLYIDLINFRSVNSVLDYELGDQVLTNISKRIQSIIPVTAVLARNFGAEYYLLVQSPNKEEVKQLAEDVLSGIQTPIWIRDKCLVLNARIGIYALEDFEITASQVLQKSQMMISAMKEAQGEAIQFYSNEVEARYLRRLAIDRSMKSALSKNEFSVHYQPIVNMKTNQIEGFESLLRWKSMELGTVFPDEFIPLAERNGFINALGDFVLNEACCFLNRISNEAFQPYITVNVSGIQLDQDEYVAQTLATIDRCGLERSRVVIEVTESVTINGFVQKISRLKQLSAEGVQIAIDDFGTGYSSINSIISLPLSYLKIDKSLTQNSRSSAETLAMIELLATFSERSNYQIVAEGIEEAADHALLRQVGIALGQGYLYCKPLPEAQIVENLSQSGAFLKLF